MARNVLDLQHSCKFAGGRLMSLKPIELPPAVAPAGRGKSIQAAGARRGGDRSGKRRTMCYSERRVLEERA